MTKRRHIQLIFLLFLTIVLPACGFSEDPLQCYDFCDKKRDCLPSLTDAEWDACFSDCDRNGYSQGYVACVNGKTCDLGFDSILESCFVDPMADALDYQEWRNQR